MCRSREPLHPSSIRPVPGAAVWAWGRNSSPCRRRGALEPLDDEKPQMNCLGACSDYDIGSGGRVRDARADDGKDAARDERLVPNKEMRGDVGGVCCCAEGEDGRACKRESGIVDQGLSGCADDGGLAILG